MPSRKAGIRFGWTDVCPATGLQGEVFETSDGRINRNTMCWGPEEVREPICGARLSLQRMFHEPSRGLFILVADRQDIQIT
jgi:hypothetical protein